MAFPPLPPGFPGRSVGGAGPGSPAPFPGEDAPALAGARGEGGRVPPGSRAFRDRAEALAHAVFVKRDAQEALLALPGVVGVGVGVRDLDGAPAIRVYVSAPLPSVLAALPRVVGGIPVQAVDAGGRFRALTAAAAAASASMAGLEPAVGAFLASGARGGGGLLASPLSALPQAAAERVRRYRPRVPGGVSVGHARVTAGTLGGAVRDARTGQPLWLSNGHVLSNADSEERDLAQRGDAVLQPGRHDGGTDHDAVGALERWVPLKERGAANLVDAAVARPFAPDLATPEILGVGPRGARGAAAADLDLRVKKSGRTTGYTAGVVTDIDAAVEVDYGLFSARFVEQLVTTEMAAGGDSGSFLLTHGGDAVVGLLFAGTPRATCHNRVDHVARALSVDFQPYQDPAPATPNPDDALRGGLLPGLGGGSGGGGSGSVPGGAVGGVEAPPRRGVPVGPALAIAGAVVAALVLGLKE